MSSDDRNNDEKQRDKILEKYGLHYTSADELSDVAADMADDAKILKGIAKNLTDGEDGDEGEEDDDRDN